jgi:RNA polymerase sigma-70 factor (sigma-E family)
MARRDEESFGEFMRGSSTRLLRLAWLLCGDPTSAEDLVQSTLERLYVAWPRVDRATSFAYARRVLVNLHTDSLRRRHGEIVTDDLPERGAADHAVAVTDSAYLTAALALLPSRERQCVVLRHHTDMSERDVAELLGTSVGTVKAATSRGLARLRSQLVTEGGRHE